MITFDEFLKQFPEHTRAMVDAQMEINRLMAKLTAAKERIRDLEKAHSDCGCLVCRSTCD